MASLATEADQCRSAQTSPSTRLTAGGHLHALACCVVHMRLAPKAVQTRRLQLSTPGEHPGAESAQSQHRLHLLHTLRMYSMSEALRTKEAAMKSMSFGTPQLTRSSSSLDVSVGRSTTTPGKFMFFLSLHIGREMESMLASMAVGEWEACN